MDAEKARSAERGESAAALEDEMAALQKELDGLQKEKDAADKVSQASFVCYPTSQDTSVAAFCFRHLCYHCAQRVGHPSCFHDAYHRHVCCEFHV